MGENMAPKARRKAPEIVLRDGKPAAVILEIDAYQEMLERLEDVEDLKMLAEMRKKPLKFKKLDDFLQEYQPGV
jgi:PHD/YefM family antitoxin component YafN of YafNO toxin-antitoxin module